MFGIYMFRIRTVHVYLWWDSGTDLLSPIRRILGSLQMSIFLTASRSTLQRGQRHLLLPVNLSSFRNNLRHSCKHMTQIMSYQWTKPYIHLCNRDFFIFFIIGRGGVENKTISTKFIYSLLSLSLKIFLYTCNWKKLP